MQYPWLTSIIFIINSSRTKKRFIRLRMYINAHNKKKLSCTQQNKMENMYPWKTIFKYTMTLKILTINIIINGNIVPCIVKASLNINMRDTSRERMLSDHKSAVFHHPRSTRLVYGTYPEKKPQEKRYFVGFKNPSM